MFKEGIRIIRLDKGVIESLDNENNILYFYLNNYSYLI